MERQFLFCILLSLVLSAHGVTYYVKPFQSSSPECPGQPCETFQYYLKNLDTTFNKEENVTMVFLPGNHTVNPTIGKEHFIITTPAIYQDGRNQ